MTKSIGSYEVIERRPGKGETYLARKDGERFLVRVLDVPSDEDVVEDAHAHVALAATVEHPVFLPALSLETIDDKLLAVAREPASKTTLSSLIERDLAPAAAWFLGQQIAGALAVAHATGDDDGMIMALSHGLLEPDQVFVAEDGSVQVPWLGLAPLVGHSISTEGPYAPPEQRGGGRVTPRGDMYSLAATVWAVLAGTEPPLEPSLEAVASKVPSDVREPLERALAAKVGQRRITAMEAEQWLEDLAGTDGRGALGRSVQQAKATKAPGATKAAARRAGPLSARKPRAGRGMLTPSLDTKKGRGSGAMPPFRSKASTLLGSRPQLKRKVPAARKPHPSTPPIDWNAAQKAASRPSEPPGVPGVDDLFNDESWDDEATRVAERPSEAEIAEARAKREAAVVADPTADEETVIAPRPIVPIGGVPPVDTDEEETMIADRPSAPTARGSSPGSGSGDRLSQQDLEQAFAMAESAVDALDSSPGRESNAGRDSKAGPPPLKDSRPGTPPPLRGRKDSGSMPAELLHAITPSNAPQSGAPEADADDLTATLPVDDESLQLDAVPPAAEDPAAEDPAAEDPAAEDPAAEVQVPEPTPKGPPPIPAPTVEEESAPEQVAVVAPVFDADGRQQPSSEAPSPTRRDSSPAPSPAVASGAAGPSPWSAETGAAKTEERPEDQVGGESLSLGSSVLVMLGTAAVVMGAGILWVRSQTTVPAPAPVASATAPAPKPTPKPPPPRRPPIAPMSAAPSVSAAPSASAPSKASADPSALPPTMGYVHVTFPEAAQVYINGKLLGPVGEHLEVPCGFKNVRVGTAEGKWLSDGKPVKVNCQQTVDVELKKK